MKGQLKYKVIYRTDKMVQAEQSFFVDTFDRVLAHRRFLLSNDYKIERYEVFEVVEKLIYEF